MISIATPYVAGGASALSRPEDQRGKRAVCDGYPGVMTVPENSAGFRVPENKKAGAAISLIFRQPGCLWETHRLSAPPSREVE